MTKLQQFLLLILVVTFSLAASCGWLDKGVVVDVICDPPVTVVFSVNGETIENFKFHFDVEEWLNDQLQGAPPGIVKILAAAAEDRCEELKLPKRAFTRASGAG